MSLGVRELGRLLGISSSLVSRLIRKGMPTSSVEEAIEWRLAHAQRRLKPSPKVVEVNFADPPSSSAASPEDLSASLERLRTLEKTTAGAIVDLLGRGETAQAIALRHQHAAMIKGIFDAEAKALKLAEARGELITTELAMMMVSDSLQEPVAMIRRIPDLAHDPAQKQTMISFMNACLDALKAGAQKGEERFRSQEHQRGRRTG